MRNKISMLVLSVALIVSLVLAGCAKPVTPPEEPEEAPPTPAPEEEVFEWKCQSAFGLTTWNAIAGARVIDRIEEVTEGRLKISMLDPNKIVPTFEMYDAVNTGVLDAGWVWPGYWVGKDSAFTLFASAPGGPFGFDNIDIIGWMFFGGGYELRRWLGEETGYTNVVSFIGKGEGNEPMGWFPKPLKSAADLKGIKFRAAGLGAKVFEKAGMSVVIVAAGEILPLLEKGVIDAAEFSDPATDLKLGFPDILKFYHIPGIHQPTGFIELLINRQKWEELPPDLKYMVELSCHETVLKSLAEEFMIGQEALEVLKKDYGVTIVDTPPDVLEVLLKAWDEVAAEECANNPNFAELYGSQREFASKIVSYRRMLLEDYSLAADHYWEAYAR